MIIMMKIIFDYIIIIESSYIYSIPCLKNSEFLLFAEPNEKIYIEYFKLNHVQIT